MDYNIVPYEAVKDNNAKVEEYHKLMLQKLSDDIKFRKVRAKRRKVRRKFRGKNKKDRFTKREFFIQVTFHTIQQIFSSKHLYFKK